MDVDGRDRVVIDLAHYIECMNRCFPGWGGERMAAWAFRGADFLLHESGDAGLALTWRDVELPDGAHAPAAIITGAWTLPEARGRGHFSQLIERSRVLAETRDARSLE